MAILFPAQPRRWPHYGGDRLKGKMRLSGQLNGEPVPDKIMVHYLYTVLGVPGTREANAEATLDGIFDQDIHYKYELVINNAFFQSGFRWQYRTTPITGGKKVATIRNNFESGQVSFNVTPQFLVLPENLETWTGNFIVEAIGIVFANFQPIVSGRFTYLPAAEWWENRLPP